nr:hypothetical protein [uncultured Carboxylicivirga sp.]
MKKILSTLTILLGIGMALMAQEDIAPDELRLLARPTSDSIMLRWAPTTYNLWITGNKWGYTVTRTLMMKDGELLQNRTTEVLTPQPLKPRPLNDWEILDQTDPLSGVAAQCIYGDDLEAAPSAQNMGIMDIINKATEQENRYSFALYAADLSTRVAQYHGLMYVDKEVKKGEKYLYRVFPSQVAPGMKQDTAFFFTGVDEYLPLPSPMRLEATPNDRFVTLTWDNRYQSNFFNSFWVERSDDGGKQFNRLDEMPFINTTPEGYDDAPYNYYVDTLPDNRKTYYYRVIGLSVFGEKSPPSDTVKVKGISKISSVPRIIKKTVTPENTVELEWEFPNQSNDWVQGFRIYRSSEYSKGFTLLADSLSMMQRRFVDKDPLPTAYYRMQAFNSDANGGYSIPQMVQVVDSIPPVKPTGLAAKADTSGLVILSWKPNPDGDIYGYEVYRANAAHEEFSLITHKPVRDTVFRDQIAIKTLTRHVFYKIRALDKRQNQSELSDHLKLERPDVVPPVSPRFKSITPTDTGIVLTWVNSNSEDLQQQLLYRNRSGAKDWELIKIFKVADLPNQWLDIPAEQGFAYRYLILAVDSAGNESKPIKPVSAMYNPKNNRTYWITPTVKKNKKTKEVELSWEVPTHQAKRFIIYARKPQGSWQMIDGVNGNVFIYKNSFYYNEDLEYNIRAM